jgi:hypothetical protein
MLYTIMDDLFQLGIDIARNAYSTKKREMLSNLSLRATLAMLSIPELRKELLEAGYTERRLDLWDLAEAVETYVMDVTKFCIRHGKSHKKPETLREWTVMGRLLSKKISSYYEHRFISELVDNVVKRILNNFQSNPHHIREKLYRIMEMTTLKREKRLKL